MNCRSYEPHIVDLARGLTLERAYETELARHLVECPDCAATLERERAMSAALRRLAESTLGPSHDTDAERDLLARFDAAHDRVREQTGSRSAHRPTTPDRPNEWWTWSRVAAATIGATVLGVLVTGLTARTVLRRDLAGGATTTPTARSAAPIVTPSPTEVPPAPNVTAVAEVAVVTKTGGSGPIWADAPQLGEPLPVMEFVFWPGAAAWPPFESGELVQVDLPASMLPTLGLPRPSADVEIVRADVIVGQDGFARAVRLAQ